MNPPQDRCCWMAGTSRITIITTYIQRLVLTESYISIIINMILLSVNLFSLSELKPWARFRHTYQLLSMYQLFAGSTCLYYPHRWICQWPLRIGQELLLLTWILQYHPRVTHTVESWICIIRLPGDEIYWLRVWISMSVYLYAWKTFCLYKKNRCPEDQLLENLSERLGNEDSVMSRILNLHQQAVPNSWPDFQNAVCLH